MSRKNPDHVKVLDKTSRRHFIRASSGILIAGASATLSANALASDCDQAQNDQDAGESADPKGCKPKNIISKNQPERTKPIVVNTVKA